MEQILLRYIAAASNSNQDEYQNMIHDTDSQPKNLHRPQILKQGYEIQIRENSAIGTEVIYFLILKK